MTACSTRRPSARIDAGDGPRAVRDASDSDVPRFRPPTPRASEGLSADTRADPDLPVGGTSSTVAAPFRGANGDASGLVGAQLRGADLALGPGEPIELAYQAMNTQGRQ